eukprot:scaffold240352_cov30-Tisochrysis_lutea.AAC.2
MAQSACAMLIMVHVLKLAACWAAHSSSLPSWSSYRTNQRPCLRQGTMASFLFMTHAFDL